MKTQNCATVLFPVSGHRSNSPCIDPVFMYRLLLSELQVRAIRLRWNGKRPVHIPKELYDESDHKWTKGELKEDGSVCGVKRPDGDYDYEFTFTAGPRARAWFEEQDKKYLRELLNNGKLKEVEPAVWYWWQKEGGEKIEIGDWWVRKWAECADKTGTEMAQRLQQAEQECNQYGERLLQEAKQRAEQEAKLKAQQETEARAKREQEARLAPLRTKLQSLIPDCNKQLQVVRGGNNFQFLSQTKQSSVQEFTTTLQQLDPSKLDELGLNQNIKYLGDWSTYLASLIQKATELAAKAKAEESAKQEAEQKTRALAAQKAKAEADAKAAEQARLSQLRSQLQGLITTAKQNYRLAATNLQLFPEQERPGLQSFIASTNQLDPSKLDEAGLTQNIQIFSAWQQYLSALPQRTEDLLQAKQQEAQFKAQQEADAKKRAQEEAAKQEAERKAKELAAAKAKAEAEAKKAQEIAAQKAKAEAEAKKAQEIATQKEKAEQYEEEAEGAEAIDNYEKAATNYLRAKKVYQSLQTLDPSFAANVAEINAKIEELKTKSKKANTPPTSYSPTSPPAKPAHSGSSGGSIANGSKGIAALPPIPQDMIIPPVLPSTPPAAIVPGWDESYNIRFQELQYEAKLGEGGFGIVYRGSYHFTQVAIKELLLKELPAKLLLDFKSEAMVMAKLHNPKIVQLFGVCCEPGHYCMVMEYMTNGSLNGLLYSNQEIPWSLRLRIGNDISIGLSYLHSRNIIHCDLKSLNVLLTQTYEAKLSDFGLSRIKSTTASTSKHMGGGAGTLAWFAPELLEGEANSKQSDVYSLGMTFWELAARKMPFEDAANSSLIGVLISKGKRDKIPQETPAAFAALIQQCWTQDPNQRPEAMQVAQALGQQLQQAQTTAVKSWHIDPTLKPKGRTATGFEYIVAGEYDARKVVEAYMRCPVPEMEVGRVTIIFNSELNAMFASNLSALNQRYGNPAFQPKWDTETGTVPQFKWRGEITQRFEAMAAPYQDSDCSHVKIMPLWHGTKRAIVDSIAKTGYANLASTDAGFFGKGLYGSYEAKYAYQDYGPGVNGAAGALLINWISCFSAYPVIDGDMSKFVATTETGKEIASGNYQNYDAHFIPVKPASDSEYESNFYPLAPQERATYHEVVVFEKAQALPRYIVELRKTTVPPIMPPAGPTLTPAALVPLAAPHGSALPGNPHGFFEQKRPDGNGAAQAQQGYKY